MAACPKHADHGHASQVRADRQFGLPGRSQAIAIGHWNTNLWPGICRVCSSTTSLKLEVGLTKRLSKVRAMALWALLAFSSFHPLLTFQALPFNGGELMSSCANPILNHPSLRNQLNRRSHLNRRSQSKQLPPIHRILNFPSNSLVENP